MLAQGNPRADVRKQTLAQGNQGPHTNTHKHKTYLTLVQGNPKSGVRNQMLAQGNPSPHANTHKRRTHLILAQGNHKADVRNLGYMVDTQYKLL